MSTPASTATPREMGFADGLTLRFTEQGSGRPMLVLHGGGGPQTVAWLAAALAQGAHVLMPIHPGFAGTPRPVWYDSVADLALTYLELLDRLNLRDVVVIGSSIGGWIAGEMAVRNNGRISSLVLLNAAGIQVDGHPIADVSVMTPQELAKHAFADPARFFVDPATLPPEVQAIQATNAQALAVYAGGPAMADPKLRRRLAGVTMPVLVLWGEADQVIELEYGRIFAQSFPHGRFVAIEKAGHLPHIEQPEHVLKKITHFAAITASSSPTA
jgi:pimeloyl-ACP methyl ester carboxylesterase